MTNQSIDLITEQTQTIRPRSFKGFTIGQRVHFGGRRGSDPVGEISGATIEYFAPENDRYQVVIEFDNFPTPWPFTSLKVLAVSTDEIVSDEIDLMIRRALRI